MYPKRSKIRDDNRSSITSRKNLHTIHRGYLKFAEKPIRIDETISPTVVKETFL